jgi:hypothetical protein
MTVRMTKLIFQKQICDASCCCSEYAKNALSDSVLPLKSFTFRKL